MLNDQHLHHKCPSFLQVHDNLTKNDSSSKQIEESHLVLTKSFKIFE